FCASSAFGEIACGLIHPAAYEGSVDVTVLKVAGLRRGFQSDEKQSRRRKMLLYNYRIMRPSYAASTHASLRGRAAYSACTRLRSQGKSRRRRTLSDGEATARARYAADAFCITCAICDRAAEHRQPPYR